MKLLLRIFNYFNPMDHLGERRYTYKLPLFITLLACFSIDIYIHLIAKNTANIGILAILIPFALIIYFAFRDGIIGGISATLVTIGYYFYIMYSLHYTGLQLTSGIVTTFVLGALYALLSLVVGGLKQRIDVLMEKERRARALAEEGNLRLQTILKQLPIGVLIVDAKEHLFVANEQMEKILGKKIRGPIRNETNYISKQTRKSQKSLHQPEWPIISALKYGEVVPEEEIVYIRDDKKRLFLKINAAPIKGLHGEVIAAVSTIYDFTHVKEMEMRKDDFVNMASHELKTPITSIKLYIDSFIHRMKGSDDQGTKNVAKNIKIQTDRLQKLVNDLLDVSRLQTGKLTFTKEEFRLEDVVLEAIMQLQETTSQKIIFLKQVSAIVLADNFRIYQVITNFLTNAIKYSRGKGSITVTLYQEKGRVICSVADLGIGIPRDQQKKIFDRLYQIQDDKGKTFPGFGMGLYIAREIIQRHKGDIWVKSTVGKGATFYFSLPMVRGENL